MKYNIIGDIHGRAHFKEAVLDDAINVFVGDYFSPYERMPFDEQVSVFMDVTEIKRNRPETILLIGNHDEDHWHIREGYSRFDWHNVENITDMFEVNKSMFQAAYSIENKYLITHAGVTAPWFANAKLFTENGYDLKNYPKIVPWDITSLFGYEELPVDEAYKQHMIGFAKEMKFDMNDIPSPFKEKMEHPLDGTFLYSENAYYLYNNGVYTKLETSPDECAKLINDLWFGGHYTLFNFRSNCDRYDGYGKSSTQGPMWVRPKTLTEFNIFNNTEFGQIVGHTQEPKPYYNSQVRLGICDCLGYSVGSIVIDTDKEPSEQVSINVVRLLDSYESYYR